jgi:predicted PurR-regulated permease PerM
MLTWWTNMESLAALNTWMLAATMVFAVLTGIMVFLTIGKSKRLIDQFSEDAQNYRKQVKSLEKTAEGIRKELLQTQQHQDINQLKLKTSNSSAQELRQSLLDAGKGWRLPRPPSKPMRRRRLKMRTERIPYWTLIWNWNLRVVFRKISENS